MSSSQNFLTTRNFAEKAGVSAGTVSKWLRSGKIDGQKDNGKWLIAEDQLSKVATPQNKRTQKRAPAQSKQTAKTPARSRDDSTYSVEAFSKITYLTEYGVELWLKTGRLIGAKDDQGRLGVDAASLDQPHIKRLLR